MKRKPKPTVVNKKTAQEVKKKTIPYNLRERLETNYMDLEVPDDDNYLCKWLLLLELDKIMET